MNIANSHAAAIITRKFKDKLGDISNIFPSFDLVKTTEGSLKLGLKSAPFYLENEDWKQASLFEPDEKQQEINQLKNFADSTSVTLDAFKLITKTLAAANDNDEMDEVIFESSIIDKPIITADRNTRKLLTERAKTLIQSTDFLEGKAAIREIDLDNKTVTAQLSFRKRIILMALNVRYNVPLYMLCQITYSATERRNISGQI